VGTGFTYTKPSTIEPGNNAPFEILVLQSSVMCGDDDVLSLSSTGKWKMTMLLIPNAIVVKPSHSRTQKK